MARFKHEYKKRGKIHPLYIVWYNMKARCYNPNNKDYKYYGGRGIAVCDEWENPNVFVKWALENGWEQGLVTDRTNNDEGYGPHNCRFVTRRIN